MSVHNMRLFVGCLLVFAAINASLCEEDVGEEFDVPGRVRIGQAKAIPPPDHNGYLMYCPCMGRFGNQAAHFLGAFRFTKGINRTLVLPPFRQEVHIPFTDLFELDSLMEYHRVISMEDFMKFLAPTQWPKGERRGYCWLQPNSETKCKLKDGDPFSYFWDHFNIDFDEYVRYFLSYDSSPYSIRQWHETFPASKHPVLVLRGAPASFPVEDGDRPLHRYLRWTNKMNKTADEVIRQHMPDGPFVGIHLRNGMDWENACKTMKTVTGMGHFMETPQCLGRRPKNEEFNNKNLCFPSKKHILKRVKKAVEKVNAKYVYVATDNDPMVEELTEHLRKRNVKVVHVNNKLPQTDLVILGKSDYFIGNCVSSFTSVATRQRQAAGKPTSFFGWKKELTSFTLPS